MLKQSKKLNMIVAINLILSMTLYYFILVGVTAVTYAASFSRSDDVEIEAYFKDNSGNKISEKDVTTTEEVYLYLNVNVLNEGYFKGQISLQDNNFVIDGAYLDDKVESIDSNVVNLKQINNGEQAEIKVKVTPKREDNYNLNLLNKETKVRLEGTYTSSRDEKEFANEQIVKLNYKAPYSLNTENTFKANVLTNKVYKINDENKRLVQILLENTLDGNNYPVQNTNIELTVPEEVEEVSVYSRGTLLTNGKNETEFSNDEWYYNKQTNILEINVNNKINSNENGENIVSWKKDAKDNLIVTYLLPEDFNITEEVISAKSKITLYDSYLGNATATAISEDKEINLQEEKDGIIDAENNFEEKEIYKGKIYSNEEREIKTTTTIDVRYASIEDNISFDNVKNLFRKYVINEETNETEVADEKNANINISKTMIQKDELLNMIEDKGSFEIAKNSQKIITIDKQLIETLQQLNQSEEENKKINQNNICEVSLENNYINIEYIEKQSGLTFSIKNAQKQGTLNVNNIQIIQNNTYDRNLLKQMNFLTSNWEVKKGKQTDKKQINSHLKLLETTTKANFKVDNPILNENKTNKNVKFLVLFRNDAEQYDLYNNPYVEIELPKEITNVSFKNIKVVYEDGLSVKDYKVYTNENGKNVIRVEMQGSQTTHQINAAIKGSYLVINTNLTVADGIEAENGEVKFSIYNDADVIYENEGIFTQNIQYVKYQRIEEIKNQEEQNNNTEQNNTEQSNNGVITGQQTLQSPIAEASESEKISLVKTSSIENDVREREVICYTLEVTNKTNEEIQNITIKDEIPDEVTYCKYKTGYGFDSGFEEKKETKTYEEKNITLAAGEKKTFKYYVIVNKEANNIGKTIGTKAEASIDGVESTFYSNQVTNKIIEGKIEITIGTIDNSTIYYEAGATIRYIIKVKNLTNEPLNNVVVTDELSDKLNFVQGKFIAKNEDNEYDDFSENTTTDGVTYEEASRKVKFNIGTLEANGDRGLALYVKLNEVKEDNVPLRYVENNAYIEFNGTEKYISNTETFRQLNDLYEISLSTNVEGTYITEGDEFVYTITLKNNGIANINKDIICDLPDGVTGKSVKVTRQGGTEEDLDETFIPDIDGKETEEEPQEEEQEGEESEEGEPEETVEPTYLYNGKYVVISAGLNPGGTLTAEVHAIADELENGVEQLEITNKAEYDEKVSNEIYNIIVKSKENKEPTSIDLGDGDDDGNSNGGTKDDEGKTISGIAWLDEDGNGIRNLNEKTLENINVRLLNVETNSYQRTTKTNSNGEYKFTNLENGKYIVVFEYDGTAYEVTEEPQNSTSADRNSDVVATMTDENNSNITLGLTDTITISNNSAQNIDIGLIKLMKFDLKLDKYVESIKTETSKNEKTKRYNNTTLGKAEIHRKQIEGAEVTVTYNIVVTNVGESSGYAQEITDKLPKNMNFDSSLNNGWTQSNGSLVNKTLENEAIAPGESKTLKLVLTKKMTGENTGTETNEAEITASTSITKKEDTNSSNNKGKADVIISVGTGAKTIATIIILAIATLGVIISICLKIKIKKDTI